MAHFGHWFAAPLGGDPPKLLSDDEVRTLLTSLLPPGDSKLYSFEDPQDDMYLFWDGLAVAWNNLVFSAVDTLRQEATIYNSYQRIDDWANLLGLNQDAASPDKTVAVRQTAVTAKLRESGACTRDNLQSAIAPLLGYADPTTLEIVEADRAALKALHTYSNTTGAVIGTSSSTSQTVSVPDDGTVSNAGAQIVVRLTCTNPEQLAFRLTSPNATVKTWTAGSLPAGSATAADFYLYAPTMADLAINGAWAFQVSTGVAACTLAQWSIFVEGIARAQFTGGAIFQFDVYADPALVSSPDYVGAARALQRLTQAHTSSYLVLSTSPEADITTGAHAALADKCCV